MLRLHDPISIRNLTLKNRLVMPPMATAKATPDGLVSEEILSYYDEKSKGGHIGLIIIEHSFIDPEGKASEQQLSVASDETIDGLKRLADVIHRNGSKTVMQINHAGSATKEEIIQTTPLAPSAIAHPRRGTMPHDLNQTQISGIIEDFAKAAGRTKASGFDGIEIHSAHGYLLNQFFSPLTNQRKDEYGGSLANRIKIHKEIIQAVRSEVGSDFPILLRLGASDFMEGGITVEDSQAAVQYFSSTGLDVLDISGGFTGYIIPGLQGQGYFASITEAIKQVTTLPVILTGGITEPKAADELLKEGKADLIGVGRAILADSEWAPKAMKGC